MTQSSSKQSNPAGQATIALDDLGLLGLIDAVFKPYLNQNHDKSESAALSKKDNSIFEDEDLDIVSETDETKHETNYYYNRNANRILLRPQRAAIATSNGVSWGNNQTLAQTLAQIKLQKPAEIVIPIVESKNAILTMAGFEQNHIKTLHLQLAYDDKTISLL